jgi:hypothetical protein
MQSRTDRLEMIFTLLKTRVRGTRRRSGDHILVDKSYVMSNGKTSKISICENQGLAIRRSRRSQILDGLTMLQGLVARG